jgi:hypothetical protein
MSAAAFASVQTIYLVLGRHMAQTSRFKFGWVD